MSEPSLAGNDAQGRFRKLENHFNINITMIDLGDSIL